MRSKFIFFTVGKLLQVMIIKLILIMIVIKLIVFDIIIISTSLADDEEKDNMGLVLEEGGGAGELLWHLHYHNQNHCLCECRYKKNV